MPAAPVLPTFRNAWLNHIENDEHEGYAHETGTNLLAAIVHRDLPALRRQMDGMVGPVNDLELLGVVLINEQEPAAVEAMWPGFDLLRPDVLAKDPEGYRTEVLALVVIITAAGRNDPRQERLTVWLGDLLRERGTNLAMTPEEIGDNESDDLHAVLNRLESQMLKDAAHAGPSGPSLPVRPRL